MGAFETAPADLKPLLGERISGLGLKLEGSPMERYVADLYRELEAKGLKRFRPLTYLTDEWGCPSEEPIIGIPFYLADAKLARLEKELDDLEDAREIRMYLRHEAGHAFNYAYKLFETPEWRERFGPFNRPYRDRYRPVPFHRGFVRHMEGWYAQKHPDEDFAETFAVWLTPRSRWRQRYRGWPAMDKLRYVDRVVRKVGDTEPVVRLASTDITVEEMNMTVEEFFRSKEPEVAARRRRARARPRRSLRPTPQGSAAGGRLRPRAPGRRSSTRSSTGRECAAAWCARSSIASWRRASASGLAVPAGRGGRHPRRADHVRDHALHEFPHPRELRAPRAPARAARGRGRTPPPGSR